MAETEGKQIIRRDASGTKKSGAKKPASGRVPVPFVAAAVDIVLIVVFLIISFKMLGIPIAAVGIFVVLEALLAAFLSRIPLWVHGLIFIAHLVCGGFFGKLVFMILMGVLYVGDVMVLFLLTRDYD